MPKFPEYQAAELLGITPIARTPVSDAIIWEELLTPTVRALLGPIESYGKAQLFRTIEGHFQGDESANLNGHVISGLPGGVRYPYLSVCHKTAYGALVIKRDFCKLKVTAWAGDLAKGKLEQVYLVALRDRRFDGNAAANDTALLNFPYDDPCNKPLSTELSSLEISIYSSLPGSRIKDATGEFELDQFVEKPFTFLKNPKQFKELFDRAWKSSRAPGQNAAPIKDVARLVLPAIEKIARQMGYDMLEAAPSHYHVAMWFLANKFRISYKHDLKTMESIAGALKRLALELELTRAQESWVCVLQSLEADLVPAHLRTGIIWPQDNISQASLWVSKALSSKAAELALPLS